jgi:hypothetical protein
LERIWILVRVFWLFRNICCLFYLIWSLNFLRFWDQKTWKSLVIHIIGRKEALCLVLLDEALWRFSNHACRFRYRYLRHIRWWSRNVRWRNWILLRSEYFVNLVFVVAVQSAYLRALTNFIDCWYLHIISRIPGIVVFNLLKSHNILLVSSIDLSIQI